MVYLYMFGLFPLSFQANLSQSWLLCGTGTRVPLEPCRARWCARRRLRECRCGAASVQNMQQFKMVLILFLAFISRTNALVECCDRE